MSRFLKNIDLDILRKSPSTERSCKIIERAIYRARVGFLNESAQEVDAIRLFYKNRPDISVSAWAHLADGIIAFFSNMTPDARKSMLRSRALSVAGGLREIRCLGSAWIAHMDYLKLDLKSLRNHIDDLFKCAEKCDHSALSRGCLVVAQAFHWADSFELALPWYKLAHLHAVEEGDEATLSALMHNMAWQKLRLWRAADFGFSETSQIDMGHGLLGVQSAENFDLLIGSTALDSLVPSAIAQTLTLRGEYEKALAIFEKVLEIGVSQGMARLHAELLADRAWCKWQLGLEEAAIVDCNAAENSLFPDGAPDDSAFAHAGIARILGAMEAKAQQSVHRIASKKFWDEHTRLQNEMRMTLNGLNIPMYTA
jgi:tetratricopeptide (TPR) repeat protein